MEASFLTQWFPDHAIKAICWTLIHSLWIGVVCALLAGLLISFTRKSSALIRYSALSSILIFFVMIVGLTYYFQVRATDTRAPLLTTDHIIIKHTDPVTVTHWDSLSQHRLISQAVGLLTQHMNMLFLVWLSLFILKSLKMAGGFVYIHRIRNHRVHAVAEKFKDKIEEFSIQIGIRQTVRLIQSELVKVPVVVGWIKPVILLPMGILLQLPDESILLHELAHIRRHDYLVNILQGLVETIFFFNPGLLWLSSLIRGEREACCDDIVLSRMKRKGDYLEALLAFGFRDDSHLPLAMSLSSGNQLRDRLTRMVNQENKTLSVTEKIILVTGLGLLLAFTTLSKDNGIFRVAMHHLPEGPRLDDSRHRAPEKHTIALTDTAVHFSDTSFRQRGSNSIINEIRAEDKNGKKYHLVIVGNKLLAMDINGKKVKVNDLPKFEYMIGLFREQGKAYAALLATKIQSR